MKTVKEKIIGFFDGITYWMIVFIPFSIAIGPAPTNISIGFLFSSFFIKKLLKKERFFVKTSIDLPFLFLVIISIISIFNSIDYVASIRGILKLVKYVFLYLVFVEELRDRLHVKRIIIAIILGACFASFDAIWQMVFGKDFVRGNLPIIHIGTLKRATAALPHPNSLGIYLAPVIPLVFALARYYFRRTRRILMLIVGLLVLSGLALSYSRPAGLAAFLSLFLLAIIKKDKLSLTILVIFLLIAPFLMPQDIKNWAKGVNYNPKILICNYDRISIYRNTLNMIKHHPLIGVGVNTFSKNYSLYKLPEPSGATTGSSMYAHNNFLHMAGEIGLLGLVIFIWLLIALFKTSAHNFKLIQDPFLKIISLSFIGSLTAFLINGLTETSLYNSRVAIIFWYLIGFTLALNWLHIQKKII